MHNTWFRVIAVLAGLLGSAAAEAAVDSYRFAHVTIATPWYIFIFLLGGIFAPFMLMAILAWRSAMRRSDDVKIESSVHPSVK